MPAIPDFPDNLLDLHHHWHDPTAHANEGLPGRTHAAGTPGGGLEFLTFHRNFIAMFHAWYDGHVFAAAPFNDPVQKIQLVVPWHAVPAELQKPEYGWPAFAADAARLGSDTPDFATADELGTFIELGIHNNFIHGAAAQEYNEPDLVSLHSPYLTEFYGIHGLVDYWWARWQSHKIRFQEVITKERASEVDVKQILDLVNPKPIRDLVNLKHIGPEGFEDPVSQDPVILDALDQRLNRLERQAFPGKAFIESAQRPDVGRIETRVDEANEG